MLNACHWRVHAPPGAARRWWRCGGSFRVTGMVLWFVYFRISIATAWSIGVLSSFFQGTSSTMWRLCPQISAQNSVQILVQEALEDSELVMVSCQVCVQCLRACAYSQKACQACPWPASEDALCVKKVKGLIGFYRCICTCWDESRRKDVFAQ